MRTRDNAARETSAGHESPEAAAAQPSPPQSESAAENNTASMVSRKRSSGKGTSLPTNLTARERQWAERFPDLWQGTETSIAPDDVTAHPRDCVSLDRLIARLQPTAAHPQYDEPLDADADAENADFELSSVTTIEAQLEAAEEVAEEVAEEAPRRTTARQSWQARQEGWMEFQIVLHGRGEEDRQHPKLAEERRIARWLKAERRTAEQCAAHVGPMWLDGETARMRLGGISLNALRYAKKRHGWTVWKVNGRNQYLESDIEAYARRLGLRDCDGHLRAGGRDTPHAA